MIHWFYDEHIPFHMWDKTHLLTITILSCLLLSFYLLRHPLRRYRKPLRIAIAISLIISRLSLDVWYYTTGTWDIRTSLPLELCSIASLVCAFMLLTKNQFLFNICYFIGIAGAIQAIITPELMLGFPQYRFIQFFLDHFLLITGPLLMIWLYDYKVTMRSLWNAFLTLNGIAAIVFCFNTLFDANYMFLIHKPSSASLLDVLGPYPFYLLALEVIALSFFLVLLLPFQVRSFVEKRH